MSVCPKTKAFFKPCMVPGFAHAPQQYAATLKLHLFPIQLNANVRLDDAFGAHKFVVKDKATSLRTFSRIHPGDPILAFVC